MICPYFPCGGFPSHGGTPKSFYFWIFHEINHRAIGVYPIVRKPSCHKPTTTCRLQYKSHFVHWCVYIHTYIYCLNILHYIYIYIYTSIYRRSVHTFHSNNDITSGVWSSPGVDLVQGAAPFDSVGAGWTDVRKTQGFVWVSAIWATKNAMGWWKIRI